MTSNPLLVAAQADGADSVISILGAAALMVASAHERGDSRQLAEQIEILQATVKHMRNSAAYDRSRAAEALGLPATTDFVLETDGRLLAYAAPTADTPLAAFRAGELVREGAR